MKIFIIFFFFTFVEGAWGGPGGLWGVLGAACGMFGASMDGPHGCLVGLWEYVGIHGDPLGSSGGAWRVPSLCGHWASLGIHERPIRKRGLKDLNKFTDRAL